MMKVSYDLIDFCELDQKGFPTIYNTQEYIETNEAFKLVFDLCISGTLGAIDWNTFRITDSLGNQIKPKLVFEDIVE